MRSAVTTGQAGVLTARKTEWRWRSRVESLFFVRLKGPIERVNIKRLIHGISNGYFRALLLTFTLPRATWLLAYIVALMSVAEEPAVFVFPVEVPVLPV